MSWVLDNAVAMRWLLAPSKPSGVALAQCVLNAAYLELTLRECLSLATLDESLRHAATQTGGALVG